MAIERVRAALRGISGVHVTPYDGDGAVDRALLRRVVDRIVSGGIPNLVAAGNTGEFFALDPDEIAAVHATAAEATAGRALVTAGIGRSLREALRQAKAAAAYGCDAVMAHFPADPFSAPIAQAAYFRALAEASPLPLVAYVRADTIPPDALADLATHRNVAGVKYASPNLMQFAELVRMTEGTSANWICGLAEGWAGPFAAAGARGFTSGLVNVDPARSRAVHAAIEAGDHARVRGLVTELGPFEAMRTKHGNGANVTVVKEALGLIGLQVGPVRPPGLPRLDPADRARLADLLAGWGLLPSARAAAE